MKGAEKVGRVFLPLPSQFPVSILISENRFGRLGIRSSRASRLSGRIRRTFVSIPRLELKSLMGYEYTFVHGPLASPELVEELATLYSNQYGVWSRNAPFSPAKRDESPARLREWLTSDSKIALAKYEGQVIGYAIAVQVKVQDYGVISWVTQLVIHESHRRLDVGKTLLFSILGDSPTTSRGAL